jgi:Flagellar biosynthesis protein, FliO
MNADTNTSTSTLTAPNTLDLVRKPRNPTRVWSWCIAGWNLLKKNSKALLTRQATRRLRLAETLALGEKQFVSIVEVDGEQFLLGSSATSLVLLAKLDATAQVPEKVVGGLSFAEVLSHVKARPQSSLVGVERSPTKGAR